MNVYYRYNIKTTFRKDYEIIKSDKNCNIHQKPGQQKIDRLEKYVCITGDTELISAIKNTYIDNKKTVNPME